MFKGNSGCTLDLISSRTSVIRKKSFSYEYNSRLEKQMNLQLVFEDENVKSPEVYDSGYLNDLFFFDMKYINGNTFVQWIRYSDIACLKKTTNLIMSQIINNKKLHNKINTTEVINTKMNQLINKLIDSDFCQILESNKSLIMNYDWNIIPISVCHGDLTLENIIISEEGSIYYIDFLDSFLSTWLIDVAKLLQDSLLYWSLRYNQNIIDANYSLRLQAVTKIILSTIRFKFGDYYIGAVYRLLLLNIFRIIPYVNDLETKKWILLSSSRIISLIKEEL